MIELGELVCVGIWLTMLRWTVI